MAPTPLFEMCFEGGGNTRLESRIPKSNLHFVFMIGLAGTKVTCSLHIARRAPKVSRVMTADGAGKGKVVLVRCASTASKDEYVHFPAAHEVGLRVYAL